jgi:hypothetical protein
MAQRSEFLGVYNVTANKIEEGERPFRVAIKLKNRKTGAFNWFNVRDTFVSEIAAARIYNAYAISFFGKGAILNDTSAFEVGSEVIAEVMGYFEAKPNRQATMDKIVQKRTALMDGGHVFRTHLSLAK